MTEARPGARERERPARLFLDTFGARVALALLGLVNIALVTRIAGAETYGIFATALAYGTLLSFLTDLGTTGVVVREALGTEDRRAAVRVYLQARVVLTAATVVAGAAVVPIAFEAPSRPAAWLALATLVLAGPALVAPLGQIHGSMRAYRDSVLVQGVVGTVLTASVLLLQERPTATALVGATVAASLAGTLAALAGARHWVDGRALRRGWRDVRTIARSVTLLGLGGVLVSVYYRLDAILLLRLAGAESAGLYAAAYRLLDQARLLPEAVLVPLSPLIIQRIAREGRVGPDLDRLIVTLALTGGVGLSLLAVAAAPYAVAVLMGPQFAETATLFAVLAITLAWSMIAFTTTAKVIHGRREGAYFAVAAGGLVLNVALNLALIPELAARGAAIATLVTELAAVLALVLVARPLSSGPVVAAVAAAAGVGAAAAAAALVLTAVTPAVQAAGSIALCAAGAAMLLRAFRILRHAMPDRAD
jgi:O-antigen/teichoic acid export membrane protein